MKPSSGYSYRLRRTTEASRFLPVLRLLSSFLEDEASNVGEVEDPVVDLKLVQKKGLAMEKAGREHRYIARHRHIHPKESYGKGELID